MRSPIPFDLPAERIEHSFADEIGCLTQLANSDAHICSAIGKSFTLFPGGTQADLRLAISSGTTQPSTDHYALSELLTYLDSGCAR